MANYSGKQPVKYPGPQVSFGGSTLVPNSPGYGVELEFEHGENIVSFVPIDQEWVRVGDGSLKNEGVEFVLRRPRSGKILEEALRVFYDNLFEDAQRHPERHINYRTSTHIHIDIRSLSNNQLVTFMVLCYGLEQLIHSILPDQRQFSPFCAPQFVNENASQGIFNILSGQGQQRHIAFNDAVQRQTKYSLINFESVLTHGSVEFRGFPATLNVNDIYTWLNMIYDIYCYSKSISMCSFEGVKTEIGKMIDADNYIRQIFKKPYGFNEVDIPIMEGMKNLTEVILRRGT